MVCRYFCNSLLSSQTSKQKNKQDRNLQSARRDVFGQEEVGGWQLGSRGWRRSLSFPEPHGKPRVLFPLGRKAAFVSTMIIFFSRTSRSYTVEASPQMKTGVWT